MDQRITRLHDILKAKKQIILAGPPGTSKTFAALQVVASLAAATQTPSTSALASSSGSNPNPPVDAMGQLTSEIIPWQFDPSQSASGAISQQVVWDIVQFHPSYGYEHFVSGIDVKVVNGQPEFTNEDRIFLQLAAHASEPPGNVPHVLIIDEINRGILGRIFGELILTLEYRDLPVRLPGQNRRATIPTNLYLIGTMNTADRNIALVDHALRRRFYIVPMLPSIETLAQFQSAQQAPAIVKEAFWAVQTAFFRVNPAHGLQPATDTHLHLSYDREARGYDLRDYAVGHTYFMQRNEADLWSVLRYQVIPLLEEYRREGILPADRLRPVATNLHPLLAGNNEDVTWIRDWAEPISPSTSAASAPVLSTQSLP